MGASITTRHNSRVAAITACTDIASVVLFVAIGRNNHNEGTAVSDVVNIAAPFLIALAVAWLSSRAWRAPSSWRTGIIVWLVTVFGGLELRNFVFARGTAMPFVIVTTIVLGAFIVGGRFAVTRFAKLKAT